MKIERIIQQDAVLAHVAGYYCPKGTQQGEAWLQDFVSKITHRDYTQFALVQGAATMRAIVAQFNHQSAQGTVIYTEVPFGWWMVAVDLMLDTHYKSELIDYITRSDDLRWPDDACGFERKTLAALQDFVEQWNKTAQLEQSIKNHIPNNYQNVVAALWKAVGITFEYQLNFRDEMFSYVVQAGYEDKDLVPYIMRTEDWRDDNVWYTRKQIC